MRYINIENVSFTRLDGNSYQIKDFRPYPAYTKQMTLQINSNDAIDEIITRKDFLGNNSESESYRIVDFNIVKLYEAKFDLSKIRKLDIPVLA